VAEVLDINSELPNQRDSTEYRSDWGISAILGLGATTVYNRTRERCRPSAQTAKKGEIAIRRVGPNSAILIRRDERHPAPNLAIL